MGVSYILPIIINTNKRTKMDTIDKLINSTKQLALVELKNKIQEEIDKLEQEREDADKIPF